MRCRVPLLLCALLVVGTLVGVAPVGAQSPAEETRLEAQLQDDGDARWTVVATIPLENEEDVESFRSFAEDYEAGERDLQLGVATFERAAERASRTTDREMSVGQANRSAAVVNETKDGEVTNRYGELRVSFTWESFARTDENDTMYVGDAFNTTNGTWLPALGPNQTFVIRSPPGYTAPTTSPIGAEDGDLRWEGPQTFSPGYFEIVYQPAPSDPSEPFDLSRMLLVGALALSAAALLLGLYLLWRRRDGDGASAPEREDAEADDPDEPAARGTANAEPEAAADDEPDLELLSDEERVEYLLERNGGRMKQADIVKETGWSNAKVSQLLSSMAEEGRVDKLRIGRENLISLPGEGVADLDPDGEET